MQLLQLTLNDFGVYKGQVVLDLATNGRPIIIFGGKNGSGKTTLLEAIKLCLYGSRALGYRIGRKEYEAHIQNRIHHQRKAIVPLTHASISLFFNYSLQGEEQLYEVTRSWKIKAASVQEQLLIRVDNKALSNIPEEQWQGFIDDLIPPSIADLFFFDGEKIQSLLIDNFDELTLANEIKGLLGLDIIEKTQADLDTYLYRQRKENILPQQQEKLDILEADFQKTERNYKIKNQELSQARNEVIYISGQIEKLEKQINRESSGYAFQRECLKNQLIKTDAQLEEHKKQLYELSAGLIPFALVPELCEDLRTQLSLELNLQQWNASKTLLDSKITVMKDYLRSNDFWGKFNGHLSSDITHELTFDIEKMLDDLLEPDQSIIDIEIIHQISGPERVQIFGWINECVNEIPYKAKQLNLKLQIQEQKRQDLILKIRNIPSDDVLRPIIENINDLTQTLGKNSQKVNQLELEVNSIFNEREDLGRQLKKAFDNLRLGKKLEERLALVERTQLALNEYILEISRLKIIELEKLIQRRFCELIRKPDLVCRISIDPRSFSIHLFSEDDHEEPKDLLSAGEKQMLAISLLWSLRELSGKPFPVIIDTPLGRLDSDHRENLVNRYFPKVSHQVILFSTDTEIDRDYFVSLEPNLSHTYHLDYDSGTGSTKASLGYFWERKENVTKQD